MRISSFLFLLICFGFISCKNDSNSSFKSEFVHNSTIELSEKQKKVSQAAESIIDPSIIYDPTYFQIDYPNGEIPVGKGVCTDVVIHTYRKLGVDLQRDVHEDMKANFELYPKIWGLRKPDPNIDHRRVPNLMTYFSRFGIVKPMSQNAEDYVPGDIICWRLPNGMTHIGMMNNQKSTDGERYLIVHNMGQGQIAEDILFNF